MKTENAKQRGFFDPVSGLVLLGIFGLTGAAIESTVPADSAVARETQYQVACMEANPNTMREDFSCN